MRPSCGFLLLCPSSRRRCGNSRPARASGTCRAWLDPGPMSRTRRVPDRRVLCNDVSVQCARATPHEPYPPTHSGAVAGSSGRESPSGPRVLPRPQNPSGSAWRIVKVPGGANSTR